MASPRSTNQISPSGRMLRAGGSITYNAARILADILSPLVGQSERHVKNSSAFVDKIQDLEVPPGQKLISYDVTALFTSIPVPDAIEAVQLKLSADDTLSEKTSLSIDKILELLKFCLFRIHEPYIQTGEGCSHGITSVPHHCQLVHGGVRRTSSDHCISPPSFVVQVRG